MRCRCGNEINNVPEHLAGLAEWKCQKCINAAPRESTVTRDAQNTQREEPERSKKIAA